MVCASFCLVPSKTLKGFHSHKDEVKVLIIGHKRSVEDFKEQLLTRLRTRVAEIKRAVFRTLTVGSLARR